MNAINVYVESEEISVKEGRSRKTGKDYRIEEQAAFVQLPNGERRRMVLQHENGDLPLVAGTYQPLPSAYWVGDFGALSISTRAKHWQLIAPAAKQKAA